LRVLFVSARVIGCSLTIREEVKHLASADAWGVATVVGGSRPESVISREGWIVSTALGPEVGPLARDRKRSP
jgi:hypothetical protein